MTDNKDSKPEGEAQGLVVIALAAEQVKRIKAVRIEPPRIGVVEIAGRNEQGKSSVLDAIVYGLGGKDTQPEMPVRRGQTKAQVVLTFDGLEVTRTWTAKGSYLSVDRVGPGGERVRVTKPQEFLDRLVGAGLGFDPAGFMRLSPKVQGEMFLQILALPEDPRAIDAMRDQLVAERLVVNREVARLSAVLASTPDVEAPEAEVSIAALVAEMEALNREAGVQQDVRRAASKAETALADRRTEKDRLAEHVRSLQAELAEAERRLALALAAQATAAQHVKQAESLVAMLPNLAPEIARVQEQLAGAEATNAAVRQRATRRKLVADVQIVRAQTETLTRRIEALEARKREMIAAAPFPVPGLGFELVAGAYVVTYEKVPLSQASSSLRMRVGLAIAMALHPQLRVILLREGSLLDEEARAEIERVAAERGFQVWLETVGGGKEGAFVIEDGGVLRPADEEVTP